MRIAERERAGIGGERGGGEEPRGDGRAGLRVQHEIATVGGGADQMRGGDDGDAAEGGGELVDEADTGGIFGDVAAIERHGGAGGEGCADAGQHRRLGSETGGGQHAVAEAEHAVRAIAHQCEAGDGRIRMGGEVGGDLAEAVLRRV